MFDRESKTFLASVALIIAVAVIGGVFAVMMTSEKAARCEDKNGVVVKTLDGWKCVDAKIL